MLRVFIIRYLCPLALCFSCLSPLAFATFQASPVASDSFAELPLLCETTIYQWEALIARPPEPDALPETIDSLALELKSESLTPEERSTLLRTIAHLESLQPNADFPSLNDRLKSAIQAARTLPMESAGSLVAKARLNQSALARRFMEKELQKAVLYGLKQDDFFRIMATYYQPAQYAIEQGLEHTGDPLMRLHFHLAASSLAYTFAHCNLAFTPDSSVAETLFESSAAEARIVLSSLDQDSYQYAIDEDEYYRCGALRRAALNNLAAAALFTRPPVDELRTLLDDLLRSAGEIDCALSERIAYITTAVHLARSALPAEERDAYLASAMPSANVIFDLLLVQQKTLSASLSKGGSMLPLLDEYSHFVSTFVLSLLDQGATEQAFELVRRSKWSTLTSLIAPPETDLAALRSKLGERNALLVEQFLSHEGLIQFVLTQDAPLRVVRYPQLTAHSLASGIASHFTSVSQASPLRLLLRNRPQLYVDYLREGNDLYLQLFEASGLSEEFSEHSEILIAPHLILAYVPYAGLPVSFDAVDPLAAKFLCEIAPPISQIPSSLLLENAIDPASYDNDILYFARSEFQKQAPHNGGDLPGVLREVQACRTLLPGTAYLEAEASETLFWQIAHTTRILYLATHGIAKQDSPLDSHLLLAETSGQVSSKDGYLTVRELLLHSLDAGKPQIEPQLAVLSACVTALSEKNPMYGDDLASLSRALLASGCQQVLGTLWEAHDESYSKLMPAMLGQVAAGIRPSIALWKAQKRHVQSLKLEPRISPLAAPFFWASAVCFGRL